MKDRLKEEIQVIRKKLTYCRGRIQNTKNPTTEARLKVEEQEIERQLEGLEKLYEMHK